MKTNHSTCHVHETIDLLPEFLELLDIRLRQIYRDNPATADEITVMLEMHKFAVCATAHIDTYYNHVLKCADHISRTQETTAVCPATVYNYNSDYKKICRTERFSKI